MRNSFIKNTLIITFGIGIAVFMAFLESEWPTIAKALEAEAAPIAVPLPPDTSHDKEPEAQSEIVEPEVVPPPTPHIPEREVVSERPVQIRISSIQLTAPVVPVGVLPNGEMDVPSGTTNNVGWYEPGTLPGNMGSAVMDAHVYAAFKKLRYAKIGEMIQVTTETGRVLTYRITSSMVYPKDQLPMETIFTDQTGAYLNLITCAGKLLRSQDTYSHRLVVYAELVE